VALNTLLVVSFLALGVAATLCSSSDAAQCIGRTSSIRSREKLEVTRSPESVTRFYLESARISEGTGSAAPVFSKALLMRSSSLGGKSGFKRTEKLGARFRHGIEEWTRSVATERQKTCGHFIEDIQKEKRSLRAVQIFARTCSGDM